jgi:hypothetical protein
MNLSHKITNMKIWFKISMLTFFVYGCSNSIDNVKTKICIKNDSSLKEKSKEFSHIKSSQHSSSGTEDYLNNFFNSKGIVTFLASDLNLKKDIILLNNNGTKYGIINFNNGITQFEPSSEFIPFEFYKDYYVLKFELADRRNDSLWVYTDKKMSIKKKLLADKRMFLIENWKDFFIGSMIDFDYELNPLKKYPNENTGVLKNVDYNNIVFEIIDVKNDWINIKCSERCGYSCENKISGWIKWNNGKDVIIKFSSTC